MIVETKSLPDRDDFTYTSYNDTLSPGREKFLLRQYWLAQGLMYLIYEKAGFAGIKVMRGALITLTLAVLFYTLSKRASPIISYGFLYLAFDAFKRFIGERPQLFSFLFAMLLVVMLERARRGEKDIYFIPPLMLLWANMHGGFILGDVIIAIYLVAANVEAFLRKSPFPSGFSLCCILSVLFSFVNPNGPGVVTEVIGLEKYYSTGIQEMQSPYKMFFEKTGTFRVSFIILIFLSALPLLKLLMTKRRGASIEWGNYIAIYALLVMSLRTSRYIIFFATAGAWLMALEIIYFDRFLLRFWETFSVRLRTSAAVLVLAALAVFYSYKASSFNFPNVFSSTASRLEYPFEAVDFIKKHGLRGRLFNDYGWGGFLIWNLYPENRVFIDSRALNYGSMVEYSLVISGIGKTDEGLHVWEKILKSYDVDCILIAPLDRNGNLYPLVDALYENERWALVHASYNSLFFVKVSDKYADLISEYSLPSEKILDVTIAQAVVAANRSDVSPHMLLTLGDAYRRKGEHENARKAYEMALYRDPGNRQALDALKETGAETEMEGGRR